MLMTTSSTSKAKYEGKIVVLTRATLLSSQQRCNKVVIKVNRDVKSLHSPDRGPRFRFRIEDPKFLVTSVPKPPENRPSADPVGLVEI
jgi:hypothetical protein